LGKEGKLKGLNQNHGKCLCFGAFQQRCLQQQHAGCLAVRWRPISELTPFGLVRLPVRAVRERGRAEGEYLSLSRVLLKPKARRLLSPWIEKRVLEPGTWLNYRPAGSQLWHLLRLQITVWLIWSGVQFSAAAGNQPATWIHLRPTGRISDLFSLDILLDILRGNSLKI
jgi:hypothetical protein